MCIKKNIPNNLFNIIMEFLGELIIKSDCLSNILILSILNKRETKLKPNETMKLFPNSILQLWLKFVENITKKLLINDNISYKEILKIKEKINNTKSILVKICILTKQVLILVNLHICIL